jgi:hypothetical protein
VRIGNAASDQFQLDVYGEVMDSLHVARRIGVEPDPDTWALELALMQSLEQRWREPDEGIWEVRGPRRHFTHSKVMAWVAFDRAIPSRDGYAIHALQGRLQHEIQPEEHGYYQIVEPVHGNTRVQ